jgi:hypothetical protein
VLHDLNGDAEATDKTVASAERWKGKALSGKAGTQLSKYLLTLENEE